MIVNVLGAEIDVSDIRYVSRLSPYDSTDLHSGRKELFIVGFNDGNYLNVYKPNTPAPELESERLRLIEAWKHHKERGQITLVKEKK